MDVVTHGLAGAFLARTAPGQRGDLRILAATSGALAPDLDVVARLWDPMAAITVHRAATHSLVGGLVLALGVAAALTLRHPRVAPWNLLAFAYAGVLSHIGLDLLTPFGTAVLWPFASRRFGLGWLYVIDPVVVAILVAGLLASVLTRFPRRAACTAIVILGAYVAVAGALKGRAEAEFRKRLATERIDPARVVVVPVFPGPIRWSGVADGPAAAYRVRFWLGRSGVEAIGWVPRPPGGPALAADSRPEVQAFLAFARVPWRTVFEEDGTRTVEYRDLAFEDHPGGGPMSLRIRLDASGAVAGLELGHKL